MGWLQLWGNPNKVTLVNPVPLSQSQQTQLDELERRGRVSRVTIDHSKAERFISQAIEALEEIPLIKVDQIRYDSSYNAAHDVGEALMAAYGYRTTNGPGQHMALGEFLVILFSDTVAQAAAVEFDDFRVSRNQLRYKANPIGKAKANGAIACANDLLAQARITLGL